jgi:antirestriction protein ArdC
MTGQAAVATDRLAAVHAQLLSAVDALVDGPAWRQMLEVAARFHRYSPNNVLLITVQRPDATRVAGYQTWREVGRQVRKGETGIAILAPVTIRRRDTDNVETQPADREPDQPAQRLLRGFRVTHVFDISQTEGEPLPEVLPELLAGSAPFGVWETLMDQIEAAGYEFGYADIAPANGRTDFSERTVVLRSDLTGAQSVKTLAHELAHVMLHQPDEMPAGFTRARAEVEAESVAHVVCAAHGLATGDYTVPYVAGWASGDRDLVQETSIRVLATARQILRTSVPGDDGTLTVPLRMANRTAGRTPQHHEPERTATRAIGRAG